MMSSRVSASPTRTRRRVPLGRRVGDLALLLAIVAIVSPLVFAVMTAIRPEADVIQSPLGFPTRVTFDNFVAAFSQMNYAQGLFSTVVILLGTSVLTVALGSMASYPLSRIGRNWSKNVYRLFLLGTTVPIWVLLAPLYLLVRGMGLLGSYPGVILIYTAGLLPVSIFFYTSFIRQVPTELEEAASIDGAGSFRTFFQIVFPLLAPMTVTLLTYISLSVWNDLVIPLIFLQSGSNGTIMSNAYSLINPKLVSPTTLFPAVLLGVIPLLIMFIALQRYVVSGVVSGAVK